MIDSILQTATRIKTFNGAEHRTTATGFFFERGQALYLATSRHVFIDKESAHAPDRIEIDLHVDRQNLANVDVLPVALYKNGVAQWRQGTDSAGEIDVATIELDRSILPASMQYLAFTPGHILSPSAANPDVEVGTSLLAVGFPLGFHDTLHRMPVVRYAILASSFGLRFQGMGYFLTDARTHRGLSGAPIVMRAQPPRASEPLPWMLLGVHSSSFDMSNREESVDDRLGLNAAWYADILLTLTEPTRK